MIVTISTIIFKWQIVVPRFVLEGFGHATHALFVCEVILHEAMHARGGNVYFEF